MAQLISGTTIDGHTAIHAGNLSAHSIATTSYVTTQINNLINGAPGALDTLDELAAALGDDSNFASSIASSISGKVSKTGDSMSGTLSFGSVTRQMLDLWSTSYGIGVQSSTLYFRSDSRFSWHKGGVHNNSENTPGTGGTLQMTLDGSGNLSVTGTLSASGYNASNWNTAYGWGNHASAGYAAAARTLTINGTSYDLSANRSWSVGTVTSVGGTGTVSGLTLTGTVTGSGNLTLGGTLSASIDNITDEHRIFNNMGDNHSTRTSFDASTPSYNFGFRFVQGSTNGPAAGGGNQFYSWYLGLGNDYPATGGGSYGMHVAIPRQATTPYMSIRYNENNSLGSWIKIAAGYADTAGALSSMNISQFTNNSGYLTGITSSQVTTALGFTPYNATNPNGYTSNTGTVTSVSGTGTVSGLTLSGTVTGTGNLTLGGTLSLTSSNVTTALGYTPANSSHNHDGVYVRAYTTTNDNIDSDWGQSFKTFDPVPSGTPPISSPNLRTINIGENFSRRTQLAFNYATDQAWFRRNQDGTWYSWREFIHSGNIGSQSVSYATTAGALTSMNISQFTNNSGYLTGITSSQIITALGYTPANNSSSGISQATADSLYVAKAGGSTVAGITYFSNGESINLYGIRGRYSGDGMHLYGRVDIGNPSGWGAGIGNAPTYGLSTFGGAFFAYNQGTVSIGALGTAKLHVIGNTSGQELFAVDGVNGRLFSVVDDLSDSLYSVNTIAGLPVLEVFANNIVTIGKFGTNAIYVGQDGRVGFGTTDFSYTAADQTSPTNNRLFVNGSIQLLGANDAIVFGRGTGTVLRDEKLAFGWGSGWFMEDADYLRVLGNKTVYSGGSARFDSYVYLGGATYYLYQANSGIWTNGNLGASGDLYLGTRSTWLSSYLNQAVLTSSSPTFGEVYTDGWFRNNGNNEGLYNQANGNHFYSRGGSIWGITGNGGSVVHLQFRINHESTLRGSVYGDGSGFGLLDSGDNWRVRVDTSGVQVYGSLTIGNTTSSDIYMTDTDETTRRIHTNSGRIGFLNSSASWGAYCDNTGNWRSDFDMHATYFYGGGSIRVGDMWGGAGLYRPSGSMVFGIENSDWIFSKGAVTQAYFAGGDGNLWMRWAGDWLSNLLGAKQNASTAINTSNIGSQSVNYASSAGSVAASGITGQTGMWTSAARPGAYRLYRNDDNSAYNVQTTWSADVSGYWSLRGYNGDTYHAPCYVGYSGYASSAGSVAWTNVSGRPTALSSFTNDLSFAASSHTHDDRYYTETEINNFSYFRDNEDRTLKVLRFTGVGGDSGNSSNHSYAIYQGGGSWSHPYPDLHIGYHTGIKIGANTGYGGTRFYSDSDMATELFSVGNGDTHVRVANNLYASALFDAGSRVAISRGEGRNYIDYSRYVYNNGAYSGSGWIEPSDLGVRYAYYGRLAYNNGAYSGSGWVEPSDLGVRYANSANSANYASYLPTAYAGGQQTNPQVYFNNGIGLKAAMTGAWSVWSDTLWVNGYSGGDVRWMCALHFLRNSEPRMAISAQTHDSSGYGTYYEVITAFNIASQSVSYASTAGNVNSISSAVGGSYSWTGTNYFVANRNTTSDSPPLQVYSNNGGGAIMSFHRGGYYAVNFGLDSDNVMRIGGWSAGTNRWQLDMSGNMTVAGDVTAFSDARVKTNVQTIENALDKTLSLRGVSYNRTDSDDTRTKIGVIAQETLEVVPEVVNQDNSGMYNVSYGNMTALLIEAIKEQQAQIEDLKAEVKKLRGE